MQNAQSAIRKLHAAHFGYVEQTKPGELIDAPLGGSFLQWNSANTEIATDLLNAIRQSGIVLTEVESPRPGQAFELTNDSKFCRLHIKANVENHSTCVWLSKR